jgi:hemolysin activation/secretion protein
MLWIVVSCGAPVPALYAQGLPQIIDPTGRSSEPRLPERETKPLKPPPPAQDILPPVERPDLRRDLREGPILRVFVTHIEVLGSTVFSEDEFRRLVAPYENREVTTEDLEELRRAITLLYVNKGYVNSGAVLPDQSVLGGVVHYHVIEGRLSDIHVEGTRWFRDSYLANRIALGAGPPFNMNPLRDRLQLLLQDPRLERLNAELKPGEKPGDARLDVQVQEANPIKVWTEFNNYQPPVVGAERGLVTVAHQNLTGNGDTALVTYGRSRGVNPLIDASYTLPLNAYDTSIFFGYRQNDFTAVEDPFRPLDIQSEAQIFTLMLRQPIYRTLTDEVALSIMGERLYNKTTLLGQPFDFAGGYQDGVAVVSALRFMQEWTHRTALSVLAVRSRLSVGINVLGATINAGPVPDSQFVSWSGQANWVKRFASTGIELLNRMDLQLANDRLFPLEQFAVGGRYSVRGYRENTLIRDNAFLYSVEVRLPLLTSKAGYELLQLAPFVDVGRAWFAKGPTPSPETLASIGVGLRWNLWNRANANIYWGQQLNHVSFPETKQNLQDYGIHVQFVWNVF